MKDNHAAGFSVVELLVVISVTTILSIAVTGFIAGSLSSSTIASAKANLLGEAQQGISKVTSDIRLSSSADLNNRWADSNGPSGSQFGWQSDSDTLILASAAQDSNGNVIFQDASRYVPYKNNYVYYLQNGTLYKRILAASVTGNAAKTTCPAATASATCPADKVILHNVSSLAVSYLDRTNQVVAPASARSIRLSVTLQKVAFRENLTATYTTRMVFRNG